LKNLFREGISWLKKSGVSEIVKATALSTAGYLASTKEKLESAGTVAATNNSLALISSAKKMDNSLAPIFSQMESNDVQDSERYDLVNFDGDNTLNPVNARALYKKHKDAIEQLQLLTVGSSISPSGDFLVEDVKKWCNEQVSEKMTTFENASSTNLGGAVTFTAPHTYSTATAAPSPFMTATPTAAGDGVLVTHRTKQYNEDCYDWFVEYRGTITLTGSVTLNLFGPIRVAVMTDTAVIKYITLLKAEGDDEVGQTLPAKMNATFPFRAMVPFTGFTSELDFDVQATVIAAGTIAFTAVIKSDCLVGKLHSGVCSSDNATYTDCNGKRQAAKGGKWLDYMGKCADAMDADPNTDLALRWRDRVGRSSNVTDIVGSITTFLSPDLTLPDGVDSPFNKVSPGMTFAKMALVHEWINCDGPLSGLEPGVINELIELFKTKLLEGRDAWMLVGKYHKSIASNNSSTSSLGN
jgi:hypothetical protein